MRLIHSALEPEEKPVKKYGKWTEAEMERLFNNYARKNNEKLKKKAGAANPGLSVNE